MANLATTTLTIEATIGINNAKPILYSVNSNASTRVKPYAPAYKAGIASSEHTSSSYILATTTLDYKVAKRLAINNTVNILFDILLIFRLLS